MKITISKGGLNLFGGYEYWVHTHINGQSEIFSLSGRIKAKRVARKLSKIYSLKKRSPTPVDAFKFGLTRYLPEIVYEN